MSIFAPVQHVSKVSSNSAASVVTGAITTTASGSLFVAVVVAFANTIGAVTDSKANSWSTAQASTGTTNGFVAIFYTANATGGASHTFTFTPTSNDFIGISVFEITGASSTPLSNHNGSVANSTTHTSPSITSGSAVSEVFIGGGPLSATGEGVPVLNSSLWYLGAAAAATSVTEGIISAFRFVNVNITDSFSFTTSSARNEGVVIAGFKAASAGGASEHSATFFGG